MNVSSKVMVINSGSSSLKFKLFDMPSEEVFYSGAFDRIGESGSSFTSKQYDEDKRQDSIEIGSHVEAVQHIMATLIDEGILESLSELSAVGHRISHGGTYYEHATLIDEDVMEKIGELGTLSPLHNPVNLLGIKAFVNALPGVPSVAVFDTSFSHTIPMKNQVFAIPFKFYRQYGIKRYGFHGISHQYIAETLPNILYKSEDNHRVISCHLGSGSSISAFLDGVTVNNSMGFTPLAGVVMGTRSGDIDPQILPFLAENEHLDFKEIKHLLNHESGLLGISETSNNCRDLEIAASNGDKQAELALDVLIQSIRAYIGSYIVELGGLDTIVFTAGIGENSAFIREKVCQNLEFIGLKIDKEKNENNDLFIQDDSSKVKIVVLPTDEEVVIARETYKLI